MLTIPNVVLRSDFAHLSKEDLRTICTELELTQTGSVDDLSGRIWDKIKDNKELQNTALDAHQSKLLCGKTAITWYNLQAGASLKGAKKLIIASLGRNPFEEKKIPSQSELTTDPVIIGATQGKTEHDYYLRFMYRSGVLTHSSGVESVLIPLSKIVTVYINEELGCIEVRANSKIAKIIAAKLAKLIEQTITLEQIKIMAKYGNNIEAIANELKGDFIDATAKPELLLKDFNTEQADAVLNMLKALDSFFEDDNIDILKEELEEARGKLGSDAMEIPFTALVLAGLEKVGLGVSGKDLRGNQLYNYLNEYMQHQGGCIQFKCPENQLSQSYTVRVGLNTNSVSFSTPATESAIKYVRDRIIINSKD
ncbi:hypothetical protein [Anaeroarcus burkinensis]|uniref:hypothetical protein n=1 Tax=Anaeroarcus burkinensis TaxID=82376 RepID=UPI0004241058|nr:hypothetical protein [Anaeroarcus burkinensis]